MTDSKKKRATSPNQLRNLAQYRNYSDEEYAELMLKKEMDALPIKEFEDRITRTIDRFAIDYDLDDLKVNDRMILRALAQATITLEDLETQAYRLRADGLTFDNITLLDKIQKQLSELRSDISNMNTDLNITRKVRKGDKNESVVKMVQDLTAKAREFYESSMSYVFCPTCNNLLGTVWFHYPNEARNKITLICNRDIGEGNTCNTKVSISSTELMEKRGVNIENIPEYFK